MQKEKESNKKLEKIKEEQESHSMNEESKSENKFERESEIIGDFTDAIGGAYKRKRDIDPEFKKEESNLSLKYKDSNDAIPR